MQNEQLAGREAQAILAGTRAAADRFYHDYVGTEHLLLSLASQDNAKEVLAGVGTTPESVRRVVERLIQSGHSMTAAPDLRPYTPRAKRVIELALAEAGREVVLAEHLIAGMILEQEGIAAVALHDLGVTIVRAREAVKLRVQSREGPCEHVQKFLSDLQGLYVKGRHFVTLDAPINAHCHCCSGIHKIPEDLMRKPSTQPVEGETVEDRARRVVAAKIAAEHPKPRNLTIRRYVTGTIHVRDQQSDRIIALRLEHPVTVWTLVADDGVGVWEEVFSSEAEKNAFVRGYRAAASAYGDMNPKIMEDR